VTGRQERYSCTVERDEDGRVLAIGVLAVDLEGHERLIRVNGARAAQVAPAVHDIVRAAGTSGRIWTAPRPIALEPVAGAQVELVIRAIKPLRRVDRMAQIGEQVSRMSREEASYWHAKASRPAGLRALRVLLTEGSSR
jgi:hypothetical protein